MIRKAREEDIKAWKKSQIIIEHEQDILVEQWLLKKRHKLSKKLETIFRETVGGNEDAQYSLLLPTGLQIDSDIGKFLLAYSRKHPNYFSVITKSRLQVWNLVKNEEEISCTVITNNEDIIDGDVGEIFIQLTKQK